jgi:hypothetical protein
LKKEDNGGGYFPSEGVRARRWAWAAETAGLGKAGSGWKREEESPGRVRFSFPVFI